VVKKTSKRHPRRWPSIVGTPEERASRGLARLEDITRLVSAWVWETDGDGHLVFVSDRVKEVLGFLPVMLVGKTFSEMGTFMLEGTETIGPNWRAPFRDLPFDMLGMNGEIRHLLVSGLPFYDRESWELEGFCGTAEDITKQSQYEIALRESEERHRSLFETMAQGVVYQDAGGKVITANPAAEKLLGLNLDQIQGRTSLDPRWKAIQEDGSEFNGETHPAMVALRSGEPVLGVMMGVHNPERNEYTWITIDAIPQFRDGEDKPYQVFTTFADMTERQQATEALLEAKKEADRANLAKSEFLSSMSHELRTPLNAILGFAQVLESDRKNKLSDRQKNQVQFIKDGGDRLLALIDDILDLICIDTGELVLSMESVDGRTLVDGSLSFAELLATERGIVIEDRTGDSLPDIWADPMRAAQVFRNLLSNAVKFNRAKGSVWLNAEVRDDRFLRLSVTDTGPGIPKDEQSELFRPFNRMGASVKAIEGTGIGLVLSKRLAEEMGGSVGFESAPEEGSTFWVDFPLSR
jgi:signal transduction histidine kinase